MLKTLGNIIFLYSYDMSQMVLQEHSDLEIEVEDLHLLCDVCDKKSGFLRWDENYVGYRGQCSLCENDWPES